MDEKMFIKIKLAMFNFDNDLLKASFRVKNHRSGMARI
ncbi:hypothetical protein JCM19232_2066 [Vibrio ishigakensis]|uniref:Uncharacterized protein n=1 Tax=Vibrio ishigakensis TaxID=1481914 RepID=A0A0B8PFT9_9VIBR|nr:hypothetical protein JCM19232_2066 [Vibrio ishigakensis]